MCKTSCEFMAGIKIIYDWYHMYRLLSKIHASCSEMLRDADRDRTAESSDYLNRQKEHLR